MKRDLIGQQLGNYELVSLIGRSSFAEVYLGQHVQSSTQAAIKVLHTHLSPTKAKEFKQETKMIASLVHPHIVHILDFDVSNDVPFLIMDYYPRGSLQQRHPRGERVPLSTVVSYVTQVAAALQYAHSQKHIHHNVKSENMLIGNNDDILLSDFGIAAIAQNTFFMSKQPFVGTAPYMAPEQIKLHRRRESDQYALAIVTYEWLTGKLPFLGTPEEIATKHLSADPPSMLQKLPNLPISVEEVVFKALAKEPKERFTSVQDFAIALEQASQTNQLASTSPNPNISSQLTPSLVVTPPAVMSTQALTKEEDTPDILPVTMSQSIAETNSQPEIDAVSSSAADINSQVQEPVPSTLTANVNADATNPAPPTTPIPDAPSYIDNTHSSSVFTETDSQTDATDSSLISTTIPDYSSIDDVDSSSPVVTDTNIPIEEVSSSTATVIVNANTYLETKPAVASTTTDPDMLAVSDLSTVTTTVEPDTQASPQPSKLLPLTAKRPSSHPTRWQIFTRRQVLIGLAAAGVGGGIIWEIANSRFNPFPSNPQLRYTYTGHSWTVYTVAWSPNGKRITSGASDDTVQVWDATTGDNAYSYQEHTDTIYSVAWSPNGERIASGSNDKTVQVWNAANGGNAYSYHGHSDTVYAVAWSPDGQRIASASVDKTVQVWNATDGSQIYTYRGHSGPVYSVAWSPDGKRIASGGRDDTVQVWDATTGSNANTYQGHSDAVNSVAWSPNGQLIASGGYDHTVRIWIPTTQGNVYVYQGHSSVVNALAWSLDSKRIASSSNDKTVQVWNATDGSNASTYHGHTNIVEAVAWSPDNQLIASGSWDGTVQVWQAP